MEKAKKQKISKILNIVVNVLVVIILLLALMVTVNNLISARQGYTSFFGTAFVTVESGSMDGEKPEQYADKPDGFAQGDLLKIKILDKEELWKLEEGDIVSFYLDVILENGTKETIINSHRIIEKHEYKDAGGNLTDVTFVTKGDANTSRDSYVVETQSAARNHLAIGKVDGNLGGIGVVFGFFRSPTGFLVCIVIPSFLVVIYFAYVLVKEILKGKKAKAAAGAEADKEKMKEEVLAELRAQGLVVDQKAETAESVVVPVEEKPEETAEPIAEPVEEKPEEAAEPIAEPVEEKPEEAAEPIAEPVEEKPEEAAEPIAEPVEEKPEEAAEPAPEPVEEKPTEEKPVKKAPVKRAAAKKPTAKTAAKKSATTSAAAKKPTAKKATASAKTSAAKKTAAKSTAKKPAAPRAKSGSSKTAKK